MATRFAGVLAGATALGAVLSACSVPFIGGSSQVAPRLLAEPQKEIGKWSGTYTDSTVAVGGDDASAAIRSISDDGRIFILDPGASGVSKLKAGSTLLLSAVTVRKVVDVKPSDNGLVVTTETAKIGDLIKDGGFDFDTAVDMSAGHTAGSVSPDDCPRRYGLPSAGTDKAAQLTACGLPAPVDSSTDTSSNSTGTTSPTSDSTPSSTDTPSPSTDTPSPSTDTGSSSSASALLEMAPANRIGSAVSGGQEGSGSGKFGPWNYSATFSPQKDGVGLSVKVTGNEGTGEAALTGTGFISNFGITGQVTIRGCQPNFTVRATGVHGTIDVAWTAALSKGVFASNRKWHPPVVWAIPIGRVGPIPLIIKIGTGILVAPAMTGTGGGKGAYHADFSGGISFDVSAGKVTTHSGLSLKPTTTGTDIRTAGVSGFVAALQLSVALAVGSPLSHLPLVFTDVVLSGGSTYSGGVNGLQQCWEDNLFASNSEGIMNVAHGVSTAGIKTPLSNQQAQKKTC